MTRRGIALLALAGLLALVVLDLRASPPSPYGAPPLLAIGSGQAASGGFCGALP